MDTIFGLTVQTTFHGEVLQPDTKFDIYDYSRNINSAVTEYAWELGYRTIGNCNKVIEMGAELGANITDEEKVIVGENYYLRALSYFLLVNEFAQPYSNNPTQNPVCH